MAPVAVHSASHPDEVTFKTPNDIDNDSTTVRLPLVSNGSLDDREFFDVTPVIGREYKGINLVDDILHAPNADDLINELALTISQRGVVFFRAQHNLSNDLQKELISRLGKAAGAPPSSGLHIHPLLNTESDTGVDREKDQEITTISSKLFTKLYTRERDQGLCQRKQNSDNWHSDIAFEPAPASYTALRITERPPTGGDTLWASGYELYDRLSPPIQEFLSGLSVTFAQPHFIESAKRNNVKLYEKPRGSPYNVGRDLTAIHPVIRTNPTTGWRSLFPVGEHIAHINGVTKEESKLLLDWFLRLIKDNHDAQVRFRWQEVGDIAIWDNRSTFHAATFDYKDLGDRGGNRTVFVGERPHFDPSSLGRREALAKEGKTIGTYFMF